MLGTPRILQSANCLLPFKICNQRFLGAPLPLPAVCCTHLCTPIHAKYSMLPVDSKFAASKLFAGNLEEVALRFLSMSWEVVIDPPCISIQSASRADPPPPSLYTSLPHALTASFSQVTCVLNVVDVFSDVMVNPPPYNIFTLSLIFSCENDLPKVARQFYLLQEWTYFYIALAILFTAQCSYAILFNTIFASSQRWSNGALMCSFLAVLPFGQLVQPIP